MSFDPVPVRRPREQVETQLRAAIIKGTFRSGQKLPSEMDLAERFSVSRTTVREALRSLADDGLVRKVPGAGGGSFVTAVDHHSLGDQIKVGVATTLRLGTLSMREILQVRNALEVPAAGLAAGARTEVQLAELRRCVDEVKNLQLGDPRIADLDARFHSVTAESSGNRMLGAFVRALHEATRPVQYFQFTEADGRETVLQHIAIVRALTSGDEDDAHAAMRAHLTYLEGVRLDPESGSRRDRNPMTV